MGYMKKNINVQPAKVQLQLLEKPNGESQSGMFVKGVRNIFLFLLVG